MEFYNRALHTARKKHECEYCGKEIAIGERYSYESGKYCGDFFTRKLCLACYEFMDDYCTANSENEFDWWVVTEYLEDTYCQKCEQTDFCDTEACRCPKLREYILKGV